MSNSTFVEAVGVILNRIKTKANSGGEDQLTPEQIASLAAAANELSQHENLELAVLAVANGHLDAATLLLNTAQSNLEASLATSVSAITNAKDHLNTTTDSLAADLAVVNRQDTRLAMLLNQAQGYNIGSFANMMEVTPDNELREIQGIQSDGVSSAIFSDDGAVYLHQTPQTATSGASGAMNYRHDWLTLPTGSDMAKDPFTLKNYCHNSTNSVRTSPSQRYGYYPVTGQAMLAKSDDPNDIQHKMLIADSDTANAGHQYWRGIGFFFDTNYGVVEGHYNNCQFRDKYGRYSIDTQSHSTNQSVTALYDNTDNKLVVIQDLKVWYLYNDGWVDPSITTFADAAEAQAWVDAQADMFLISLTGYGTPSHLQKSRFNSDYDYRAADEYQYTNVVLSQLTVAGSSNNEPWNYPQQMSYALETNEIGKQPGANNVNAFRCNTVYLWESATKTLVPVGIVNLIERTHGHTGSAWVRLKQTTQFARLDTNELLRETVVFWDSKAASTYFGTYDTQVPLFNPYQNVMLQNTCIYRNSVYFTRMQRLQPSFGSNGFVNVLGEYK